MSSIRKLNKFTTIPVLIYYLHNMRIPLLDPADWEDKNDSYTLLRYAKENNINKILATCFSMDDETIHHWKTFSPGSAGCCIEFNPSILEKVMVSPGFRCGAVDYHKITSVRDVPLKDLPFIKRFPYRIEHEYRVIYEGKEKDVSMPFRGSQIRRITIAQSMPLPIFESNKAILADILPGATIVRSTIYDSDKWKSLISISSK